MLSHLSQLGLRVNWEKSKLLKTQRISYLSMELDSVVQIELLTQERAQLVLNCLNTFKSSKAVPLNQFQRLLGHMRPPQHWPHGTGLPPNLHPVVRFFVSSEQVSRHAVVYTDASTTDVQRTCSVGGFDGGVLLRHISTQSRLQGYNRAAVLFLSRRGSK